MRADGNGRLQELGDVGDKEGRKKAGPKMSAVALQAELFQLQNVLRECVMGQTMSRAQVERLLYRAEAIAVSLRALDGSVSAQEAEVCALVGNPYCGQVGR